jgi:hypothetical protein
MGARISRGDGKTEKVNCESFGQNHRGIPHSHARSTHRSDPVLTWQAPTAAVPESGLAPSELAFAFGGRPIAAQKVSPQALSPEQPTSVACCDSELLSNIVEGEAELAETVGRNEKVEPAVRSRVLSHLLRSPTPNTRPSGPVRMRTKGAQRAYSVRSACGQRTP